MKTKEKTRSEQILEQISKIPLIETVNLQGYIVPRGKSIIVERRTDLELDQTETKSGLIIQTSNEGLKSNLGVIVAVGNEVPEDLKIGSIIYFNQNCNLEVLIKGKNYLKMHEIDAYFILNLKGKIVYLKDKKIIQHEKKHEKNQNGIKENYRVKNLIQNDTSKLKPKGKIISYQ